MIRRRILPRADLDREQDDYRFPVCLRDVHKSISRCQQRMRKRLASVYSALPPHPTLLVRLVPGFLATTRLALLASGHSGVLPAAPSLQNDPTNRGLSSHLLVAWEHRNRGKLRTPNLE